MRAQDYLLLGTSAAPLRKALNDSHLGAALVGGGMDDELKQPIFSVGLKVSLTNALALSRCGSDFDMLLTSVAQAKCCQIIP